MITPCIDCMERTPGCHATCEAYARWRKSYDKMVAVQKQEYSNPAVSVLADYSRKKKAQYIRHTKGWK